MVLEPVLEMENCGKSNAEFRTEILARHESSLDQVNYTLQKMSTELQALRITHEINPLAHGNSSQSTNAKHPNTNYDHHQQYLKLYFPKFSGEDPMGGYTR